MTGKPTRVPESGTTGDKTMVLLALTFAAAATIVALLPPVAAWAL